MGIAGAKALGQERAGCVQGTVKRLAWPERHARRAEGGGGEGEDGIRGALRLWRALRPALGGGWRSNGRHELEHSSAAAGCSVEKGRGRPRAEQTGQEVSR